MPLSERIKALTGKTDTLPNNPFNLGPAKAQQCVLSPIQIALGDENRDIRGFKTVISDKSDASENGWNTSNKDNMVGESTGSQEL